jgi:HMG (high mobility group) box
VSAGSNHKDGEDDGSKKRKRTSKPKDPNAPKRPASSYILFQNDIRTELKKQNPNLSNPQLLSLISDKWKNMTEEEKEVRVRRVVSIPVCRSNQLHIVDI